MKGLTSRPRFALLSICLAGMGVWIAGRLCPEVHGSAWFSWRHLGAFAAILTAALGIHRLLLRLLAAAGRESPWDVFQCGLLQLAALVAVHPYVTASFVGAGDANSYSLSIADFLQQRRAGIFPVLIGQSEFAFSGGFQPLRNAPYFDHLAWAFHVLSLGTLNAFALQNLVMLASITGAMLSCYAVVRLLGRGTWLALGLAFLYGFCPGVLAPLYGGDMLITFTTLPFVPWLVFGIERSAANPTRFWPWALQGVSLAALWLGHPPVGAWSTLLAVIAGLWILAGRRAPWVLIAACSVSIFAPLTAYLFISVAHLDLPSVARDKALGDVTYKVNILREVWAATFQPVSADGSHLLSDIQLGYGVWACLLCALAGAIRSRTTRPLLICVAVLLVFAWPFTSWGEGAWRSLPTALLVITNQWPMERFYVILAAFAVVIVASGFGEERAPRWMRLVIAILVPLGCLWELKEAGKFFVRGAAIRTSIAESESRHLPENIVVSRTHSYEYLGSPSYYSDGHVDPALEMRLLDADSRAVFADGSTPIPGAPQAGSAGSVTLKSERGTPRFRLETGDARLLRFDFLGTGLTGELRVIGERLSNFYALPASGMPKAFGSGPMASHTLLVRNTSGSAENVTLEVTGGTPGSPVAQASMEPLDQPHRAVRLESQTPLRVGVTSERDAYLETSRLFVPGYEASVDGKPARVGRSAEGLVVIPVPKGEHEIVVSYPGDRLLRGSFWFTAGAWAALLIVGVCLVETGNRKNSWFSLLREADAQNAWNRSRTFRGAVLLAAAGVVVVAVAWYLRTRPAKPQYGAISLSLELPWTTFWKSEPLVTTGRPGAGDFIYVTYVDGRHITIGHDRWSVGGSVSAPILVDYSAPQTLEVTLGSLYPDKASEADGYSEHDLQQLKHRLSVTLNGKEVLVEKGEAHPSTPEEVSVGANLIGGSTTTPAFSGRILSVRRVHER